MNNSANSSAKTRLTLTRTSEILRSILTKNPGVQSFTVERILDAIGHERIEASLMLFSMPAIVPVPSPLGMSALPTGAIGCQLAAGQKQVKLPQFVLKKSVSRRSLAVAIHTLLPVLEAAEKLVRPRWHWVTHPLSRRLIGLLVFVLAIAIAQPLFGFEAFHSTSIFAMSLGMAEHDGLAVLIGVVAGVLSLAVLVGFGMSARVLRIKAVKLLRKLARKLGFHAVARFLDRLGHTRLARVLRFEWSQLLLLWNPEQPVVAQRARTFRATSRARRAQRASVLQRRDAAAAVRARRTVAVFELQTQLLESQRARRAS